MTSYYNPVRYKRRLSNYRLFRANLGVPLVAVELSFDGLTEKDADILVQKGDRLFVHQHGRVEVRSKPANEVMQRSSDARNDVVPLAGLILPKLAGSRVPGTVVAIE